jgi:hypothetical protein
VALVSTAETVKRDDCLRKALVAIFMFFLLVSGFFILSRDFPDDLSPAIIADV